MQNVYAFYLKAKQKTGKPSLFIWFDAKNDDRAQRDLANYIEDAELEPKDYFKAARTDYPVYDDLPPEGEFSDTWCDRYKLGEDKLTWQKIVAPVVISEKLQEKPKAAAEYFAANLDKHTVIAAAWLYGRECLKLNEEQLKAAKALVMDDSQRYPQNVILALSRLKQHEFIYPEMPIVAIAAMKAVWLPFGKVPELGKLCQFATEYLDAKVEDRADVITKWQTGGAKPVEKAEEQRRTESGAILTNGTEPATGTPIDSEQMLETVIGCALYPSDFDISNPPGSIIRAVTEMKKRNDKTLKAWNEQLSNTPGVLQFSRESIVALIRGAEENLHLTPGALRTYINANLIEIDANTAQQKTETVQQNGADAQQTAIDSHQIASNEGEKEEVATVDTTVVEFETERRAWIRGEVVAALSGDTGVMGEDDVAELMAAIGEGVSHTYVARLLAKEIEPCDPFQQLAADEIHHLTCDVLENWVDEKDPRVAFINGRVEFYLKEARQALEQASIANQRENVEMAQPDASNEGEKTEVAQQHQSPAKGELGSMGAGRFDVTEIFGASPLAKVTVDEPASNDFRENEDLTTENVREFLNSSTKAADLSGETTKLSGDGVTPNDEKPTEKPLLSVPPYFEPGRYHDVPNEVYHSANGISSTMAKDARISLMYYHGRHVIKSIQRERTDALTFGSLVHTLALEPEKLDAEFSVEPLIPEGAFTDTASMRAFIDKHNAALPKQADADPLRAVIEKHNATLPVPYALGGNADEIGQFYGLLPVEFQRIGEDQKPTATAMKACIKEYNATLPIPLKTSGSRDALLEQLEAIDPALVELERAIPAPLPVSGSKEEMATRIKTILPTAIFADELISAWRNANDQRQPITQQQIQYAKAIQRALFTHPSAGPLLQHPQRAVEVSYFGIDEETGLDVRVRPDLEIEAGGLRTGFDLKTVTMGNVKQSALRARLHREIIERDYHLSAGMYCDVAAFDQFFWIFVNKDEHYHWIAIVEASADLLELGRLEYRKTLRDIKKAQDTGVWPEPITEEIVDDINDFDQRRMEALRVA
ncbi:RecE family exodeoxyribonuclease [Serratia proteamaculans]|uniref:Exodeoxyribonuclease n=1 Tax=Serratia proteamaculans TaxID=28151 RepID=A0A5Q2VIA3_SERPR|nr:RecE family exodeoxyribonuclease [Serratia proteamaculans]QGH64188.1 exodeoxyribonuclease [Serratia proteamaculans]